MRKYQIHSCIQFSNIFVKRLKSISLALNLESQNYYRYQVSQSQSSSPFN